MSDYLPLEIQAQIVERLPVKSVIQFRSVSKAWKALIDSPEFIAAYSRYTQPHHLLIRYVEVGITGFDEKYVSFVDDDTFPQQRSAPTLPLSIELFRCSGVVGSAGGLLCLYGYYPHPDNHNHILNCNKKMAILWNPSIRKSVAIDVPDGPYNTVLGFGVCPITNDPKIVKITRSISCEVKVYSLNSGEWRTPSCNLSRKSIQVTRSQVVVDRFIYWFASDCRTSFMILSFDMTTYDFGDIYFPHSLANQYEMTISKAWESLVVLEYNTDVDKRICNVWMMEYGVPNSFTKLFTIKTPYASMMTLGFKKGGEPIIEWWDAFGSAQAALVVYEPYSEHNLGIFALGGTLSMNSYMETLLLLNQ